MKTRGTKGGKITDLNQYLTATSGLDATQREAWRNKIAELMKTDRAEAMRVFNSFGYWKQTYGVV